MSEHLKQAREAWVNWVGNQSQAALRETLGLTLLHLEAQEQSQQRMDDRMRQVFYEETMRQHTSPTPSASTSPRQNGVWLSASDAANLAAWLQQCPLPTTTAGFRLTVQPGSVTFSRLVGGGSLTIPTGTPEPPITSGSEQGEPGDRGQAPADAEP